MIRAFLLSGIALLVATCDKSPVGPPHPLRPFSADVVPDTTVVLVGAGDIAMCTSSEDEATALLLDNIPGIVFTAGDNVYGSSTITPDFVNCYGPSWGRHKARTRPAYGHLESWRGGGALYDAYFGSAAAGPAGLRYYSYDAGAWHVVVLNSDLSMLAGTAQHNWLTADLAARTKPCLLAIWHHPHFSSAGTIATDAASQAVWNSLYDAGADVVLNAHMEVYERFAPQDPVGNADPVRGIRQFTVGTGGIGYNGFRTPVMPNSEVRNNNTHGVLKLTLRPDGYDWQFVPKAGLTFTDAGSSQGCHGFSGNHGPTVQTGGPYTGTGPITFDGSATTDPEGDLPLTFAWNFGDGGTGSGATVTHTYGAPGTYTVTLTVTDSRGAPGVASTTATLAAVAVTVDAGSDIHSRPGALTKIGFAFKDAGTNIGPWTYDVNWADGSHTTGSSPTVSTLLEVSHNYAAVGQYNVSVTVTDKDAQTNFDQLAITVSPVGTPEIFTGAGNISSCSNNRDELTAQILDGIPGLVFALGDNAFPDGSTADYTNCYQPTWGRHKDRTRPVMGNHEYQSPGGAPAFAWWGPRAGPSGLGYYSYDLGDWHVIVLNDNIAYTNGTTQYQWLQADLAANTKSCTIAMWHTPLFLSSTEAGYVENPSRRPLWDALYAGGADIVLNAQQHHYERFAPMTPTGVVDNTRGIREFNVGTGGESTGMPTVIHPNSLVRSIAFGVLKLTLQNGSYSWQYMPMAGETFTDSGTGNCGPEVPNQAPTAAPGGPYLSQGTVAFDGSASSDPDGHLPLTYAWAFGDGATGTGATPSHTYATNGVYTVTLTVTDARGLASAPASTTASIGNQPPAVNAGPDLVAVQGVAVTLNGSFADAAGDSPWGWTITWGDGQTSTGSTSATGPISAQHTYTTLASYVARLTVTDKDGSSGFDEATVTVNEPVATLVGAGDIAVCGSSGHPATALLLDGIPGTVFTAGDNAYENGSTSDYANCYDPTWGRHKARTRPSPGNHEYQTPGAADYFAYYGALAGPSGLGYYSYDLGAWHIISLNSLIPMTAGSAQEQWLRADLAAHPTQCTLAYWHYPRFNSGSNDGSMPASGPLWQALYEAGADVVISAHEHVYERFGPQTPTGVADAQYGIRQFTVGTGGSGLYAFGTPLPNSEVRNSVTRGVIKLTLRANGYDWEFIPIAGQTFTDQGTASCHGAPGGPPPNTPPTAAFTQTCTDLACTFTDQSTDAEGPIASRSWSFGDGGTDNTQNPSHTYAAGGTYTVSLTVTDGGGLQSTTQHSLTVTPVNTPPTAGFAFSCAGLACTFTDQSTDAEGPLAAWSWNFGDGATATTQNPAHTYATGGTYSATLTVTDARGAQATAQQQVTVNAPPVAAFASSCNLQTCSFTDQSTDLEGPIAAWSWSFGDGGTDNTQNPSHTYAAGGNYTVSLTVTDGAGAQATTQHVVAVNSPPTAAFAFTCTALACTFTDQSTDAQGPIAARAWNFGDGATATTQNPSHTYAIGGSYTVTLTVTDGGGAQASTQRVVTVNAPPVAAFAVSCTFLTCSFTDQSTDLEGPIAAWSWTFGDGGVASTQNPSHTYASGGSYTMRLTVTDAGGAQATTQKVMTVGFLGTWTTVASGTTRDLEAAWGTATNNFWVVGRSGTILRLNGSTFSTVATGYTQNLFAVGGTSASDVWAVGAAGRVTHFNGVSWAPSFVGTAKWSGVWGSSPSDAFIVGDNGRIQRWSGTTWGALMPTGTTRNLDGVWGTSSTNVFAIGDAGTILRYNGTSWALMTSGTTRNLNTVWGTSSSNVFVGGASGLITRFNGTSWTAMTTGTTDAINAIWGGSGTEVYAATDKGRILRFDGTSWTILATPGGALRGLWGIAGVAAYAVGQSGAIVRGSP
jgi:PKD repeat protein